MRKASRQKTKSFFSSFLLLETRGRTGERDGLGPEDGLSDRRIRALSCRSRLQTVRTYRCDGTCCVLLLGPPGTSNAFQRLRDCGYLPPSVVCLREMVGWKEDGSADAYVCDRCIELAVLRIQLYYKRNGCHSR